MMRWVWVDVGWCGLVWVGEVGEMGDHPLPHVPHVPHR